LLKVDKSITNIYKCRYATNSYDTFDLVIVFSDIFSVCPYAGLFILDCTCLWHADPLSVYLFMGHCVWVCVSLCFGLWAKKLKRIRQTQASGFSHKH